MVQQNRYTIEMLWLRFVSRDICIVSIVSELLLVCNIWFYILAEVSIIDTRDSMHYISTQLGLDGVCTYVVISENIHKNSYYIHKNPYSLLVTLWSWPLTRATRLHIPLRQWAWGMSNHAALGLWADSEASSVCTEQSLLPTPLWPLRHPKHVKEIRSWLLSMTQYLS